MRAGAYTIHQSLTAEAAAVLKLALALARRRGHAQVTPLHVAFALLTGPAAAWSPFSISSSSSQPPAVAYGLLKRACLRSHPAPAGASAAAAHPLQCRALELCFNVALNRLPTSGPHSPPSASGSAPPPPFASSLIQPSPTLSNALVAALKRAQANQRRGCVELQQPPPQPTTAAPAAAAPQQQQPLLSIKVELDQLVISILDDPSVSRVMREAGFSSATVKSNLEEESALMPPPPPSSSPPPPPVIPSHFLLDPSIASGGGGGGYGLWPAQFLAAPAPGPVAAATSCNEDVRAVMEVMVRKQGRRSNPVVVGDSVSMAEAVAGELLRRLERGDVPEKLAGAHLLKLQLSYVHVRLMNRADVDARAAELRRSVDAVQLQRGGGGLVVYVGDLRWALDEEPPAAGAASPYSPVEHMVAELGRLLDDLRASRGRAWLVATASYQTYMRWQQRRRRPVESAWALQAVVVPTGGGTGLALNSLHSTSSSSPSASATPVQPAMVTMQQLAQSPFSMGTETVAFAPCRDEQEEKLVLCIECSKNYEREASLVKAEADAEVPRASLLAWLAPDRPPADHTPHKDKYLIELKRKWSRLCRKLHLCTDPCSAPCPWWSGSCLFPCSQCKPNVAGFLGLEGLMEHTKSRTNQWSPPSPSPLPRWGLSSTREPACHGVGTALTLGSLPLSDSATSPGNDDSSAAVAARELERRLGRKIPWQPAGVVAAIAEAALAGRGSDSGKKGGCVWLYVKGSERAPRDVVDCLVAASKSGSPKDHQRGQEEFDLRDSIVVLTTSDFGNGAGENEVISLRLSPEEDEGSSGVLKRKAESPPGARKRPRQDAGRCRLDLNLFTDEDSDEAGSGGDGEAVPSDITHEGDEASEHGHQHPHGLLKSVATRVVTLDGGEGPSGAHRAAAAIRARLAGVLDRAGVRVADDAVQALAAAAGHFLEEVLERWAAEVLEPAAAAATVKNGGKGVVVLGVGPGGGAREPGFMGSVLPSRVHVD